MVGEGKEVKLLSIWPSPFGQRCRIALAEKNIDYEYIEQDLADKSELLLASNPIHKKVPVLLHHGKPLCESLIIIEYIDQVWPGTKPILPADPLARAHARFWADYIDKKLSECLRRVLREKEEELKKGKGEFIEIFKTLEDELGEKKYFGGEDFGLVDIALVPFTTSFYSFEVYVGFSVEELCGKLAAWAKRCNERESVGLSLFDSKKIHDFVSELRKKFGAD